ncbi:unnamed protein product [Amoebophrya sp. A25]|nr:unnamed protein product [Amoebophrya sp. A25]|eukprot:GSA25T00013423001.1
MGEKVIAGVLPLLVWEKASRARLRSGRGIPILEWLVLWSCTTRACTSTAGSANRVEPASVAHDTNRRHGATKTVSTGDYDATKEFLQPGTGTLDERQAGTSHAKITSVGISDAGIIRRSSVAHEQLVDSIRKSSPPSSTATYTNTHNEEVLKEIEKAKSRDHQNKKRSIGDEVSSSHSFSLSTTSSRSALGPSAKDRVNEQQHNSATNSKNSLGEISDYRTMAVTSTKGTKSMKEGDRFEIKAELVALGDVDQIFDKPTRPSSTPSIRDTRQEEDKRSITHIVGEELSSKSNNNRAQKIVESDEAVADSTGEWSRKKRRRVASKGEVTSSGEFHNADTSRRGGFSSGDAAVFFEGEGTTRDGKSSSTSDYHAASTGSVHNHYSTSIRHGTTSGGGGEEINSSPRGSSAKQKLLSRETAHKQMETEHALTSDIRDAHEHGIDSNDHSENDGSDAAITSSSTSLEQKRELRLVLSTGDENSTNITCGTNTSTGGNGTDCTTSSPSGDSDTNYASINWFAWVDYVVVFFQDSDLLLKIWWYFKIVVTSIAVILVLYWGVSKYLRQREEERRRGEYDASWDPDAAFRPQIAEKEIPDEVALDQRWTED